MKTKKEVVVAEAIPRRVIIEKVTPDVDGGAFPVKRVPGEQVVVRANVFADGHDEVLAFLLWREAGAPDWTVERMRALGNDGWAASFTVSREADHEYAVRGWVSPFTTWRADLRKKVEAKQDVAVDLKIGAALVAGAAGRCAGSDGDKVLLGRAAAALDAGGTEAVALALGEDLLGRMEAHLDPAAAVTSPVLRVAVDRLRARFSSWYEFFPRSWSPVPGRHGTLCDCEAILPDIARMGFDVVYLPPIHPIGRAFRKGRNNATVCAPGEPGCPWAIGGAEGGHKAVHPDLGTLEDFRSFVAKARGLNMEVALDVAFQCSPDHPYVKAHPSWFKWRPDGTVQYAENPPKKYEDVLPFNFETDDWRALWEELKSVFTFWCGQGVRIFRVDNPHTKPFLFWDWVIAEVRREYPGTIFLAEAFTRPNIMYRLAKGGFTQSYTYFTWRNTKREFEEYLTELAQTGVADFFRPNFWPNTPDILPEHLQFGGRPASALRAVLAATLSSNFGIYGPVFELCVVDAIPGKEEYVNSEKYEIARWDWNRPGNIKELVTRLNAIRRQNPALQLTRNIRFCRVENDQLLAYYKATGDHANIVLTVVNLDPHRRQSGTLHIPLEELGIGKDSPYQVHDLLSGAKYIWQGARGFVDLDPAQAPAHVFLLTRQVSKERDFDYFL